MIHYQKAKTWDPAWAKLPKYAQQKEDGHRLIVQRAPVNRQVFAMTSSFIDLYDKLKAGNYHWMALCEVFLDPGYQLDGELVVPGGTSEDVKTAIKTLDPDLTFRPFATTALDDTEEVVVVNRTLADAGFQTVGFKFTDGHTLETLMKLAEDLGTEGWVLKDSNYGDWYKLKRERTIDLMIYGVTPGRNKYTGMIGSFELWTSCGTFVGSCAGMPDEVRAMDPGACVHRAVEVKYQRVGANGKLVLPRFKCFRDDKLAPECGLDQDPELAAYWNRKKRHELLNTGG